MQTTLSPIVTDNPTGELDLEGMAQVVLYNDNVNTFEHVVGCLVQVFGHPRNLAEKLALDAHKNGRTIAEVESRDAAILHKEQLQSFGLTVDVERI